jgi:hypothetical protein
MTDATEAALVPWEGAPFVPRAWQAEADARATPRDCVRGDGRGQIGVFG